MPQLYGTHPGRELVVSGGFREILTGWSSDASREQELYMSSDHEEADTVRGYYQVNVLCHETDVLALFLAHRQDLCQ